MEDSDTLMTELLVMPDGTILVHNLTESFADLLAELNPACESVRARATNHVSRITYHNPASPTPLRRTPFLPHEFPG